MFRVTHERADSNETEALRARIDHNTVYTVRGYDEQGRVLISQRENSGIRFHVPRNEVKLVE